MQPPLVSTELWVIRSRYSRSGLMNKHCVYLDQNKLSTGGTTILCHLPMLVIGFETLSFLCNFNPNFGDRFMWIDSCGCSDQDWFNIDPQFNVQEPYVVGFWNIYEPISP